ncbi:hypothetical protein D8674_026891 [Pyrus ussuriensis x Pyrus communis]|uniref:Uncharacterized protein n=1 Tax=Pyrus ussuriensis x Pyrus communis TaxID=2448454 RepID=A0A5N5IAS3_9ROSA|nr:hypothetical protein D8674_026891 [Pyrus ussuriensis x Pyrus communis]
MALTVREEKQKQAYQGTSYDQLVSTNHPSDAEPSTMAGSRSPSIRLNALSPPMPTPSSSLSFANVFLRLSPFR